MRRTAPWVSLASGSIALAVALFGGCGDDAATGDGGDSPLADVIYQGETTDEGLEALLAALPKDEPAKAAVFDAPLDAAILPATPAPLFQWHPGGSTAVAPRPREPTRLFGSPADENREPSLAERLLGGALSGVREAHAHGTPISGNAYFLVFATEDDPKLVRVFTRETAYTPDAASWARMTSADKPITASILSAYFESNRVTSDGGPWESGTLSFTIEE